MEDVKRRDKGFQEFIRIYLWLDSTVHDPECVSRRRAVDSSSAAEWMPRQANKEDERHMCPKENRAELKDKPNLRLSAEECSSA